jgi:predicted HNH restriction endonuclease
MSNRRTYKDRAAYIIKAVTKRRKKLREKAIEYKGGKCCFCGYKKFGGALEFHHVDENKKDFGISLKGLTRSWAKIKNEIDKCVLVCANCHRELHGGTLKIRGYGEEIVQASEKSEGNL